MTAFCSDGRTSRTGPYKTSVDLDITAVELPLDKKIHFELMQMQ